MTLLIQPSELQEPKGVPTLDEVIARIRAFPESPAKSSLREFFLSVACGASPASLSANNAVLASQIMTTMFTWAPVSFLRAAVSEDDQERERMRQYFARVARGELPPKVTKQKARIAARVVSKVIEIADTPDEDDEAVSEA